MIRASEPTNGRSDASEVDSGLGKRKRVDKNLKPGSDSSGTEQALKEVRMEAVFFIGAFVLLTALIYGSFSYRYRDRAAQRAGEQIVRDRYRHDQA